MAAIGTATAAIVLSSGIGVTEDSVRYIAGAEHLSQGRGYLDMSGEPVAHFPPGYSVLISLGLLAGLPNLWSAGLINLLLAAAAALICASIIGDDVQTPPVRWAGYALVALNVPLAVVSTNVWSETAFIFFGIASMAALARYQSWRGVLSAGALAAGAVMTRYIGVAFVAAGVGWLWMRREPGRFRNSLLFGAPAGTLLAWNLIRNLRLTGATTGNRALPTGDHWIQDFRDVAITAKSWFFIDEVPLVVGLALGAAIAFYFAWRYHALRRPQLELGAAVHAVGLSGAVYLVAIIVAGLLVNFDPPRTRILSPAYLPLIVLFLGVADRIARAEPSQLRRLIVIGAVFLMAAGSAMETVEEVESRLTSGPSGFTQEEWTESPLVAAVSEKAPEWSSDYDRVYSNNPWATYWFSDLYALRTAVKHERFSSETGLEREDMCAPGSEEALLLWYLPWPRDYQYNPEEVAEVCTLVPIIETTAGSAYVMTPGPGS